MGSESGITGADLPSDQPAARAAVLRDQSRYPNHWQLELASVRNTGEPDCHEGGHTAVTDRMWWPRQDSDSS